ncbi:MAG TPA: glycosyltransferase family 4 protein [Sphingomicrobium sp.]|nr:glycosyltransferase family 4 protein [Sphingomicrobium sp.]
MTKPKLFIFTGADQVTGALISGVSQANILRDVAEVSLILSERTTLSAAQWPDTSIILLPLARASKRFGSIVAYPAALLRSGWHLRRALKQAGCDRLQINDFHFAEGAIVRLLGYRGRIVTWVRIDPKRYGTIGRIWLGLARWSSDELVVVSKFIAGRLPPDYRSTLIYNAVPPVVRGARSTSRRLLFVGNYIEGKGQDDAIRAFHRISAQFPEAELLFHGSDMGLAKNRDYRASLDRLAEQGAGKGRIHIRDFVEDPGAIYREAYAALNFSHSESFSLTCVEGSAHGLAVLATRCGGPEEIVADGVTGFLVPVGDIEAMAARMVDLLGDPALAAAMGEAGRQLVNQRFGTDKFRQQLLEIFDLN